MSEINSPKYPKGNYPELSPNPNEKNGLVNGGQETPVIVNTNPKTLGNKGECSCDNAWVDSIKDKIVYDADNNEVQVGVHLYADGDFETGGDIVCGRDLCIDSLQNIQDNNGDPFIPDASGHLNEALVHYTSGYTWKKGYDLAGFEVVRKSVFEGEGFVYQTHKVYFVWNDTAGENYGTVYIKYYEA